MQQKFLRYELYRGKQTKLGMYEKLTLMLRAKQDAIHGLPKEEEGWTSPTIQREVNACREKLILIYGTLETDLAKHYAELEVLLDSLKLTLLKIKDLVPVLTEKISVERLHQVKKGEENLDSYIVQERRKSEFKKERENYRQKWSDLMAAGMEQYEKLVILKNFLNQEESQAEAVCARITRHMMMRNDYYWRSLYYYAQGSKKGIPAVWKGEEEISQLPVLHSNYQKELDTHLEDFRNELMKEV